jgi:hypothetical protein
MSSGLHCVHSLLCLISAMEEDWLTFWSLSLNHVTLSALPV